MSKKKPTTKKEKNQAQAKKIHIINESLKQHKKGAEKAITASGGVPDKFIDIESGETKWQDKLAEMRGSIGSSRSRMRARGKAVFQGR